MIDVFFLFVFVQKSFLTKIFFIFAEINLTTRGPLYTCLVLIFCSKIIFDQKLFSYCWDKIWLPVVHFILVLFFLKINKRGVLISSRGDQKNFENINKRPPRSINYLRLWVRCIYLMGKIFYFMFSYLVRKTCWYLTFVSWVR